jgi:hypothetical protein
LENKSKIFDPRCGGGSALWVRGDLWYPGLCPGVDAPNRRADTEGLELLIE